MKKTFMGVRLKRLREEQRLTQAALAGKPGFAELPQPAGKHQRPLTVPVLLRSIRCSALTCRRSPRGRRGAPVSDSAKHWRTLHWEKRSLRGTSRTRAETCPRSGARWSISPQYRHAATICGHLRGSRGPSGHGGVLPSTPFEEVRDFSTCSTTTLPSSTMRAESDRRRLELPVGR